MTVPSAPPRILVIDDLFGRSHRDRPNEERANLCGQYLLEDVSEGSRGDQQRIIVKPAAQAVFHRGQTPACAEVGDVVENDLPGILNVIRKGWSERPAGTPPWAMILLDLCFYTGRVTEASSRVSPGMPEGRPGDDDPRSYFGLRVLDTIQSEFPDLPVVILSSKSRDEVSREFSTRGALGFLAREHVASADLLKDYIVRHGLIPDDTGEVIGNSKQLLLSLRAARRASLSRRNVLIRGERGTGKELLARYLHRHGSTPQRELVTVDSGTLSPSLFASELFGHKRGAFTGADRDREGRIVQAHGGDLFLDEIGNMPPEVQVGLLRVVEYRKVEPLGAGAGISVDVRFLSATNEDIEGKALTGSFRADLLDRLREGGTLFLPPLRERVEDIPLLVEKFVRDAEGRVPGALRRQIEPEAVDLALRHGWPGNLRELRDTIYDAVANHPDVEHLVPRHLSIRALSAQPAPSRERGETTSEPQVSGERREGSVPTDLRELIEMLEAFPTEPLDYGRLAGALSRLEHAYANLAIRLLAIALKVTSKPDLEAPQGRALIHPAAKLLTNNARLTASQAADTVKKIFSLLPNITADSVQDPLLKSAYETALRLRPRRARPDQNTEEPPEDEAEALGTE